MPPVTPFKHLILASTTTIWSTKNRQIFKPTSNPNLISNNCSKYSKPLSPRVQPLLQTNTLDQNSYSKVHQLLYLLWDLTIVFVNVTKYRKSINIFKHIIQSKDNQIIQLQQYIEIQKLESKEYIEKLQKEVAFYKQVSERHITESSKLGKELISIRSNFNRMFTSNKRNNKNIIVSKLNPYKIWLLFGNFWVHSNVLLI